MRPDLRAPGTAHLVPLDPDHPGFRDPRYRARRDAIARVALGYRSGAPVPPIAYRPEEHALWGRVWRALRPLHGERAARELVPLAGVLGLGPGRLPQLAALNAELIPRSGFRMEPVAGLVCTREFLERLGQGVFLATQYLRHPARPLYTPEPDVVHEVVGHAASLLHPGIAALSRALGRAAAGASAAELERLGRLHWFTLEFGVVDERGAPRAVGAGLLSSPGELARFASAAELLDYDPGRAAETPYDPTDYQPRLFAAPSLAELVGRANRWVRRGAWRDRSATISAGGPGPAGPRYGGDPGRALPAARPLPREKGPSPCAPASSPPRSSP